MKKRTPRVRNVLCCWLLLFLPTSSAGDAVSDEALARELMSVESSERRVALLADAGQRPGIVSILLQQAEAMSARGDRAVARRGYEAAAAVAAMRQDTAGEAKAVRGLGLIERQEGRLDTALEHLQRSLDVARGAGLSVEVAEALRHMGGVYRLKQDYTRAAESLLESVRVAEASSDKTVLSYALNSLALLHSTQGDYALALPVYERSLALKQAQGDRVGAANTLGNIALAHYYLGDYTLALEKNRECLGLWEALSDRVGRAHVLNSLGLIHKDLGDHALARDYFQQALALEEVLTDRSDVVTLLNNLGLVQQALGQVALARTSFHRARDLGAGLGRKRLEATILYNLGALDCAEGDCAAALDAYRRYLELVGPDDQGARAFALLGMAEAYGAQRDAEKALAAATESAALFAQAGVREPLWRARLAAGRALRALARWPEAQHALEEAIAAVESLRDDVVGEEQTLARFFEARTAPYREMVDLLASRGQAEPALLYAERARARVLVDVLQGGRGRRGAAMTEPERLEEQRLRTGLRAVHARLQQAKTNADRVAAAEARDKLRREYEAFRTQLYIAHPELRVRRGELAPLAAGETAALLTDADTAVLEYTVTLDAVHLWLLTRGGDGALRVDLHTLDIRPKDLAERVARFRSKLSQRDLGFKPLARELYAALVQPVQRSLAGKTTLILVPDGPLWELPFQALQPADDRFLLDDHSIRYVPSLTVLREMSTRVSVEEQTPEPLDLLAFGDPTVGEALDLPPLADARRQVRALERLYGARHSRVYVGALASEAQAKADAEGGAYRVVHLATHGVFNDAAPLYSHLRLAANKGAAGEDGRLEAREILDMTLKADLVVLSACDSGRGQASGEGLIGFTWALFVAGCPMTVVSQWRVDAASTTELLMTFHRRLRAGLAAGPALRRAALALRRDERYRHPFYWAAFVVVGGGAADDTRRLFKSSSRPAAGDRLSLIHI